MLEQTIIYINQYLSQLPPFTLGTAPYYIINVLIFIIVYKCISMIFRLAINRQLIINTEAYTSNEQKEKRILILGDSTAVGTGASSPEETIAGRLAHDFPNSQVINLGKNGGLIKDLRKQIDSVKNQKFDMIIISAGGNDVWHFTRLSVIRKYLTPILNQASMMSNNHVLMLIYNNIGDAPIFPSIIQILLKWRCNQVQTTIQNIALIAKVPTIDLFSKVENNPFIEDPEQLFASDGIHPSSKGYKLWYNRMWRLMVKRGFQYGQRTY